MSKKQTTNATKTTKAPKSAATKAKSDKPAKAPKAPKADGKLSAIDAAAKVLGEAKAPLNTKEMIEAMAAKKYWTSPGGKTPHATLYSAILREIQQKGKEARFAKSERGKFALNGGVASAKPTKTKAGKTKATKPATGEPGPKAVAELFKI